MKSSCWKQQEIACVYSVITPHPTPAMFAEHTLNARHHSEHKKKQDLFPVIRSWMMNARGGGGGSKKNTINYTPKHNGPLIKEA